MLNELKTELGSQSKFIPSYDISFPIIISLQGYIYKYFVNVGVGVEKNYRWAGSGWIPDHLELISDQFVLKNYT